jgi:hypothetical protein
VLLKYWMLVLKFSGAPVELTPTVCEREVVLLVAAEKLREFSPTLRLPVWANNESWLTVNKETIPAIDRAVIFLPSETTLLKVPVPSLA